MEVDKDTVVCPSLHSCACAFNARANAHVINSYFSSRSWVAFRFKDHIKSLKKSNMTGYSTYSSLSFWSFVLDFGCHVFANEFLL